MIDFLKLNISYMPESELCNPLIEWKQTLNRDTGEIEYPIIGKYFNLDIKINPTRKEISGSIHKLRNELKTSQNQNYDDFTFDDGTEMIFHLKEVFNLDLKKTIIENLEIGLNINTDKPPQRILNENLIVWKNKTPSKNKNYNGNGKYIEFETAQFYVKIYDKGKQYDRPENILRFECKIKRNDFLRKLGIQTLNDLLIRDHLKPLQDYLFETFMDCIIVDDLSPETITEAKEREIFTKGINPFTWTSIKGMQKKRFKEKFNKILESYKMDTLKREISEKLKSKGDELLLCYKMNDFEHMRPIQQMDEMLKNEAYIYTHNITSQKCKITAIDISHQKRGSKFLSQASIKVLSELEPETFKTLVSKFGPRQSLEGDTDKLCFDIAHNIRNKDSNRRHEVERKILTYKNSLFPLVR